MTVLLTLTIAGIDSGPFDLYSNLDGYTVPFELNISKASLQAGYLSVLVPDYTVVVRIKSKEICINSTDVVLATTTTTTTAIPEVVCDEVVISGGVGVTELSIDLLSSGGLITIEFNAQSVPDKLELIHNNIKKATTGMTVPNEGPFDNIYGDPTVPTEAATVPIDQFIGSSKGAFSSRQATYTSETGSPLTISGPYQQLIWWEYTNSDYLINPNLIVRITGPEGTSWDLKRLCLPATTTTTSTTLFPPTTTSTTTEVCTLAVGQDYAGGTIIYLDGSGCHGIVAAKHDMPTTPPSDTNFPGMTRWMTSSLMTYSTSAAFGTGLANTNGIYAEEGPSAQYAAQLCKDYAEGGYTDWYLPSQNEMTLIYNNRVAIGNWLEFDADTRRAHYWTSTKFNGDQAMACWFYTFGSFVAGSFHQQYSNYSGNASRVRAVRNF